jgi:hypothetical protein
VLIVFLRCVVMQFEFEIGFRYLEFPMFKVDWVCSVCRLSEYYAPYSAPFVFQSTIISEKAVHRSNSPYDTLCFGHARPNVVSFIRRFRISTGHPEF